MAIKCLLGDSVHSVFQAVFDPMIAKLYSDSLDLVRRNESDWLLKGGSPTPPPRFKPWVVQDEIVLIAKERGEDREVARSPDGFALLYDEPRAVYLLTDLANGKEVSQGSNGNWWLPGNNDDSRLYIRQSIGTNWKVATFDPGLRARLSALAERA